MRVALFFESEPRLEGGVEQSLSTIEALVRDPNTNHQFVVFTPHEAIMRRLASEGISSVRFGHRGFRLIDRWSSTVLGGALLRRLRRLGFKRLGRHLDALLDDHGIALALVNDVQNDLVLRIGDHPFIVTVWDLDQRDHPEFPETYSDRIFERIERSITTTLRRAVAVIVNSQTGAQRLSSLYAVDAARIIVLPFLPSLAVRKHSRGEGTATIETVRSKYALPHRYVFYPGNIAHHKNCLYLLEGLMALERDHGIKMHAVFCGKGPDDVSQRINAQVEALGLASRVHILGFVPDGDVPALYEGALALVMPSYFGPTNLPPIEAATLSCPVICSDLPGCREQMGEAALYCDLSDPSNLADLIAELANHPEFADRLRASGAKLASKLASVSYGAVLAPVLDEFDYVRRRWSWPEIVP